MHPSKCCTYDITFVPHNIPARCFIIPILNLTLGNSLAVQWLDGEGNGDPLQYSCLKNPIDRGAWWATTVYALTKSQT